MLSNEELNTEMESLSLEDLECVAKLMKRAADSKELFPKELGLMASPEAIEHYLHRIERIYRK